MKICHISDVHFRGITRHEEYTSAFNALFKYLREVEQPDLIINTGDFYHSKTSCISPEVVSKMSWCLRELADIAPTYSILGNHDCNLKNTSRDNIIASIHNAINDPRLVLIQDSGNYSIPEFPEVCLNVLSPVDHKNWSKVLPQEDKINIALFHGSVKSSKTDLGWELETYEAVLVDFTRFDFVLLGDIHKQQFLSYRLDKNQEEKPWIGYPGSFIQQNHGEDETKGVYIWDIRSKDDWDVKFVDVENTRPFLTIPWINNSTETLQNLQNQRGSKALMKGIRFRISSSFDLTQIQRKQIVSELKGNYLASEVVFKYEKTSNNIDNFKANGILVSKKRLRNDPETISNLYRQFIANNNSNQQNQLTESQIEKATKEIEKYLLRLNEQDDASNQIEDVKTTLPWILNFIEFDNLFRYGTGNRIDFTTKEGLIGIFGPNRWGKSSCVAAIMYVLFNATDRGPLRGGDIINQHKDYCSAKASISVGGKTYLIERKTTKVKKGESKTTGKVELFEVDSLSGALINKNEDSRCDTDKQIRQLIGTPEDFFLTTLAAQNDLNRFISEGSTKRKKYLSKFLEIDIFENLYGFAKEDVSSLTSSANILSDQEIDRQAGELSKTINRVDNHLRKINERKEELLLRKEKLQLWIGSHEQNAAAVDDRAIQRVNANIMSYRSDLEAKTYKRESMKKKVSEKDLEIAEQQNIVDSTNITNLETELASYRQLKETVQALKHSLDVEKKTLTLQEKTVKKLDMVPCGDSYPNCHYIKDAHEDKAKIAKQREHVSTLIAQFQEANQRFENGSMLNLSEKIQHYKSCETNLILFKSQRDKIQETVRRLSSEIDNITKELSSFEKQEKDLAKKINLLESEEFKKKKSRLEKTQTEISSLEKESQSLYIKIGSSKTQLSKLEEDKERFKDQLNRVRIYSSIQTAFSKTGIPAMILNTQLPAINAELAKILSTIVDFKIELEADTNSNAMDVYIVDNHSKRIIELCSGMEKTICSIALRVALINLSSLPRPDMFIMDEPFGALDEDNQQKCLELLETLKQYFNQVVIISHEAQVKELVDTIIEIDNDGVEASIIA